MTYLINQYNLLSNTEKNAIIIYKTSLGAVINSINKINPTNFPQSFIDAYTKYKLLLNNVNNMFLKFSVFYAIDDLNIFTFYNSLLNIKRTLLSCQNKIKLSNNLTVYRGISLDNLADLALISKSDFASTSTNKEVCESFFNVGKYNVLDIIEVEANTPVIVAPYAIKKSYKDLADVINQNDSRATLSVKYNDSQEEIILFKDLLNIKQTKMIKTSSNLIVRHLITSLKVKEDGLKR